MSRAVIPVTSATLLEIQNQFKQWRGSRRVRGPIPEALWEAAAGLCESHSIHEVAKALGLNYTDLKERVKRSKNSGFVELKLTEPFSSSHCTVQMYRPDGAKLTMDCKGEIALDLLQLGKAFWSYGK